MVTPKRIKNKAEFHFLWKKRDFADPYTVITALKLSVCLVMVGTISEISAILVSMCRLHVQ